MSEDSYESLAGRLEAIGLIGQQRSADQLIVSSQRGPVWPDQGNSFWVSRQTEAWYLSTWLPVCYRIPAGKDVVAVCLDCMKAGKTAMYQVPDEIVARHGLEEISDEEFDRLFPESPG